MYKKRKQQEEVVMAKASKRFEQYDEDKTIVSRAAKRTYAVRALVNTMRMTDEEAVNDAADMEFRDYSYEASSYVEAMGNLMGDLVQNYAFNMCVKYFQTYIEFYEKLADMSEEQIKEMVGNEIPADEIKELKKKYKEMWGEVPIPVDYSIKVLGKILEDFKENDNLIQWQEPELIVMGNPHLMQHMGIKAETVGDYAEDGIEDLAKFVMNFATNPDEEE